MTSTNISHSIKARKNANDKFYTPTDLVKVHLNLVKEYVVDTDIVFEPFYGSGNYFNLFSLYFPNNKYEYTEIELGLDFFTFQKNCDVIISNPPYSCIDKVLEKSVSLKPHTISYLIGQGNLTTKRIEYMNKNGYFLSKLFFCKVFQWYGMSLICVFTNKTDTNCILFDRVVYK